MARTPKPWFRWYVESTRDPKLRRMPAEQRWVWPSVLAIAAASPVRGYLYISEGMPATIEDIADEAAVTVEVAQAAVDYFIGEPKMMRKDGHTYVATKFLERQFESDSSTKRTAKHRSNEQRLDGVGNGDSEEEVADSAICTLAFKDQQISVDEAFDVFWAVYPSKRDKIAARRAFDDAIAVAPFEIILAGAERYRDDRAGQDTHGTKYAQGWLNDQRWHDQIDTAAPGLRPVPGPRTPSKLMQAQSLLNGLRNIGAPPDEIAEAEQRVRDLGGQP